VPTGTWLKLLRVVAGSLGRPVDHSLEHRARCSGVRLTGLQANPARTQHFNQSFQSAQAYEKDRGSAGPVLRSVRAAADRAIDTYQRSVHGLMTLGRGRQLVPAREFSVGRLGRGGERTRPRIANLPPAALAHDTRSRTCPRHGWRASRLRSGTAPLDSRGDEAFLRRYDLPVLVQYGATSLPERRRLGHQVFKETQLRKAR